ncbi:MAG: CotH kinase family protein [Lachnospiraceae bacterium]|nr:CotH kinase family protein [Lachnospiraceae bacterium]
MGQNEKKSGKNSCRGPAKLVSGLLVFGISVVFGAGASIQGLQDSGNVGAVTVYGAEEDIFVPSEIPAPEFSVLPGFYDGRFDLELTVPEGTEVYYTLDGSEPVQGEGNTFSYTGPIPVESCGTTKGNGLPSATVVRAVAVTSEGLYSDIQTGSYFVARKMTEWYEVPVISLVTEPEHLYGEETGILTNYEEKGRDWERPAHFEYFLPEGTRKLSLNVGVRVNGAYSRRFEMKSLRVYARSEYDTQKSFNYDFFSGGLIPAVEKNGERKNIEKFKRLVLRGGGNESDAWEVTFFRDILTQSLMVGTSLDVQAYQPAVVFLNGEFYGILNIRERMDDRYLASHYNCAEEDVAVYGFKYNKDGDGKVILPPAGEDVFYVEMEEGPEEEAAFFEEAYDFVTLNDMSDPAMYAKAQEYFDIENFIDYLCVEMYCGNTDWPHNNCEAWRYTGEPSAEYGLDGKIRWLLFDTDFGFGLYGHPVEEQVIASMVADQRGEQPYRDVLTCLFRAFLRNEGFKTQFKDRFIELLNTNFRATAVLEKVDALTELYKPLVAEKYLKYGERHPIDYNMTVVRDYAATRTRVMINCLDWVLDEELHDNAVSSPLLKTHQIVVLAVVAVIVVVFAIFFISRKKERKNY